MNVKVWYIIKTTISKQHKYEKVVRIVGSVTLQTTIPPAKKNLSQFSIVIMHLCDKKFRKKDNLFKYKKYEDFTYFFGLHTYGFLNRSMLLLN